MGETNGETKKDEMTSSTSSQDGKTESIESPNKERSLTRSNSINKPLPTPPSNKGPLRKKSTKLLPSTPLVKKTFIVTESNLPSLVILQKYFKSSIAKQFCVDYTSSFAKRRNILFEIIESEKTYINGLDNLYRLFLLPLKEFAIHNPEGAFLSSEEVGKIFGQIDLIMNVNKELLSQMLEMKETFNQHSLIGPLFEKTIPKLKMYTIFVNGYDEAMETLEEAKKKKTI